MIKIIHDNNLSHWAIALKEHIESFNTLNAFTSRFVEHGRIEYLDSNTKEIFLAHLIKKEGEVFIFKHSTT